MDFDEKLQLLRKEHNMTQEELAEKLFVSRTAISKWENGRGFPNLDSLRNLAAIFSISIDDLLSGEEIITLAEKENQRNIMNVYNIIFYWIDILMMLLLFLPIFGERESEVIQSVNLMEFSSTSSLIKICYYVLILLTISIGMLGLITYFRKKEWYFRYRVLSVVMFVLAVIAFMLSQQPYPAFISFVLLIIKFSVIFQSKEQEH